MFRTYIHCFPLNKRTSGSFHVFVNFYQIARCYIPYNSGVCTLRLCTQSEDVSMFLAKVRCNKRALNICVGLYSYWISEDRGVLIFCVSGSKESELNVPKMNTPYFVLVICVLGMYCVFLNIFTVYLYCFVNVYLFLYFVYVYFCIILFMYTYFCILFMYIYFYLFHLYWRKDCCTEWQLNCSSSSSSSKEAEKKLKYQSLDIEIKWMWNWNVRLYQL
jgi:hypothetical protein